MKHLKIATAVLGIAGILMVGLVALPGVSRSCDGGKTKTVSADASCAGKTTSASASCASKAASGSCAAAAGLKVSRSCGATATQASAGSCAKMSASAACNPATCNPSSCDPSDCAKVIKGEACATTHVVYRVSVDGQPQGFYTFAEAKEAAGKNDGTIEYVAVGKTYETESEAQMAMLSSLRERINSYMTVAYQVNGETMHCGVSAQTKAASCGAKVGYHVANRTFEKKEDAEAYLAKLQAAVESIKLVDAEGRQVEGCAMAHKGQFASGCDSFTCGDKKIDDPMKANLVVAQERLHAILATGA